MGYFVGDIPGQPLVVDPVRDGEPIDLTYFDGVTATLYDPEGVEVELTFDADIEVNDTITVTWPAESPFTMAGIYVFRLRGEAVDISEMLPLVRVTADEPNDGWYTLEEAREDWRDAPLYDATLWALLWSSRGDVLAYAPDLELDERPPVHYKQSQLDQARNKWNAGKVDPANGSLGDDTFVVRPFPLDWAIKQNLRPATNRPVIG